MCHYVVCYILHSILRRMFFFIYKGFRSTKLVYVVLNKELTNLSITQAIHVFVFVIVTGMGRYVIPALQGLFEVLGGRVARVIYLNRNVPLFIVFVLAH